MKKFPKKLWKWSCCLLLAATVAGCAYDDTDLKNELDDLKGRIEQIEQQVDALNAKVQEIVDNAVTPLFGTDEEGYLTVSYDGGATSERLLGHDGQPINVSPDCPFFTDVTCEGDVLHLTLADGTVVDIPLHGDFYVLVKGAAELNEFEYGQSCTFEIESLGVEKTVITKPDEWRATLDGTTLTVTAPGEEHAACAESEGEISLICFSADNRSCAASLKVVVLPPKTIDIEITGTYIITNSLYEYKGEMAAIDAKVTPSDDDFLYHVTQYRVSAFDEGEDTPEEEVFNTLLQALNYFILHDGGWAAAEQAGLFTQGVSNHSSRYMLEGEDYRIAAFGIKKDVQNGVEVAVATTALFRSEVVHTPVSEIDLSANGSSNCYIVNSPNTEYCFNAKVMGNGKATTGITPAPIEPKAAFLVWATDDGEDIVKDVTLDEEGYVHFVTGSKIDGNALIAVTDGVPADKASKGTILWSWHIWAIDYTPENDKKVINHDGKEYTMMDCNLGDWSNGMIENPVGGAYGSSEYWGLKYQWGRKDPFINVYSAPYSHSTVFESDYDWDRIMSSSTSGEQSLTNSIQHPTTLYYAMGTKGYDWYGGSSSDSERNNNLWGNADADAATAVKTIYDPCPAGYKVAPLDAFSGFFADGLNTKTVYSTSFNTSGSWNKGHYFITSGEESSYFPAAGYIDYMAKGMYVSTKGYYFVSDPEPTGYFAKMLDIESFSCKIFDGTSASTTGGLRTQGASIRCIRE